MKTLLLVSLMSFNLWAEGGAVGNGGDTVLCLKSEVSPYEGMYNLDYLINVISETEYSSEFIKTVAASDLFDKQMLNIIALTKETFPSFSSSLQTYHAHLFKSSVVYPYSWLKAPYGLLEIDDEKMRLRLPENCVNNGLKTPFIQTVVRVATPSQIEFTYYAKAFDALSSLQKSFLITHEWLWNFSQDPEAIRRANAVFHSQWTEKNVEHKMAQLYLAGIRFETARKKYEYIDANIEDHRVHGARILVAASSGVPTYRISASQDDLALISIRNTTASKLTLVRSQPDRSLDFFEIQPARELKVMTENIVEKQIRLRYCGYLSKLPSESRSLNCDTSTPGNQPDFILYLVHQSY